MQIRGARRWWPRLLTKEPATLILLVLGLALAPHWLSVADAAPAAPRITKLSLSPSPAVVRVGGQLAIKALADFSDGRVGIDVTESVTWFVVNSSLATVSSVAGSKGRVRGIAAGATFLTATDPATGTKTEREASALTVVQNPISIQVTPQQRAVRLGESQRMRAIASFAGGISADIAADVEWTVTPGHLASVDSRGRLKGNAPGVVTVSARDKLSGRTSKESGQDALLTIVGSLQKLTLSPAALTLPNGGSSVLKARAVFSGSSSPVNVSSKVSWSSSLSSVATVDPTGRVLCMATGETTISVRDALSGLTSTASGGDSRVRCAGVPLGLKVSPERNVLNPGSARQMKAYLTFADGSQTEVTRSVEWSSSDEDCVKVIASGSRAGRAEALTPGVATIVAEDPETGLSSEDEGGVSGELRVPGAALSVTIFPRPTSQGGSLRCSAGSTIQLRARVQYEGGATQGINALVRWTTSDPTIARTSNGDDGSPAGFTRCLRSGTVNVEIVYPKDGAAPNLRDRVKLSIP